jgi:hypothetical protein
MKYPNGVKVKVGDKVRFERGGASGTVEMIIDADFADWSVDEAGVMLSSAPFGRVFIPLSKFVSDGVALEKRDTRLSSSPSGRWRETE